MHCLWIFFPSISYLLRYLRIGNIRFTDQSPTDDIFPNSTTPDWVAFLQNFNANSHSITTYPQKTITNQALAIFPLLAGWARNYEET